MAGEFEKDFVEESGRECQGRLEPEREDGAETWRSEGEAPSTEFRSGDASGGRECREEGDAREEELPAEPVLRLSPRRKGRRLVRKPELVKGPLTAEQRLLLLDTWRRSGLPAGDFSSLVGISRHTLYSWKKRFETRGPGGLVDEPKGGPRGSRLSEVTRRAIVMLKESNPEWGCQRISDMLLRGPALPASPSAVARVLHEAGYELEEVTTRPHGQKPKRFERAQSNDLWQSDLFTFTLKRQNRRVYLVAFLDDHSRFIVGYGLHSTQSAPLVLEVLRSAVLNYRAPREILTDNGSQYVTWRGRSAFSRELSQRGIRHIIATPRRPQTLGKIERFWGSLWHECVERAIFRDLEDARRRIGLYIDHYNFQRPHQGIGSLVPADRYFEAAPEVHKALRDRVEKRALELAREGLPPAPFYLTGNAGGKPFSVHAEGERIFLRAEGGEKKEIELSAPADADKDKDKEDLPSALIADGSPPEKAGEPACQRREPAPGTSPLDELGLDDLIDSGGEGTEGGDR